MILSTIRLNRRSGQAAADSRDVHLMHVRVQSATDGHPPGPGRLLWAQPDRWTLVIQSTLPVTNACLPGGYGEAVGSRVVDLPSMGQRIEWSVLGSPTRDARVAGSATRRRREVVAEPDEWLRSRFGTCVEIDALDGERLLPVVGRKPSGGHRIHHARWLWHGTGVVSDVEQLGRYVLGGIGNGRAHGVGLVIVRATT